MQEMSPTSAFGQKVTPQSIVLVTWDWDSKSTTSNLILLSWWMMFGRTTNFPSKISKILIPLIPLSFKMIQGKIALYFLIRLNLYKMKLQEPQLFHRLRLRSHPILPVNQPRELLLWLYLLRKDRGALTLLRKCLAAHQPLLLQHRLRSYQVQVQLQLHRQLILVGPLVFQFTKRAWILLGLLNIALNATIIFLTKKMQLSDPHQFAYLIRGMERSI